ncbi:MAG: hypothetical protein R3F33_16480 [Planctomycetota bacterium]
MTRAAGLGLLALAMSAAAPAQTPAGASQGSTATPLYVRTKVAAPVRNYSDRSYLELQALPAGSLLEVHGKSLGAYPFYEVSSPAGFSVWVFGKYVDETEVDQVLRVNSDHVNQRPRPSLDGNSTPLRARLMTGDRVLMIQRQDAGKAWAEDWIQIWSPQRTHAWVEASMVDPVTDVNAAKAEWKRGERTLPTTSSNAGKANAKAGEAGARKEGTEPAVPGADQVRPEAIRSLRYSDRMFEQAIVDKNVTVEQLAKVEEAYHRVLEMAPNGTTVRELALGQLEKLRIHKEMAQLREQMKQDEVAKAARIEQLAKEQLAADLKQTATWGRFQARGWIETETTDGETRYFVRWDGDRQAEIACLSGRYDLANFVGYQIGVQGSTRRAEAPPTLETPAMPRLIDVARIEVIAGSANLR